MFEKSFQKNSLRCCPMNPMKFFEAHSGTISKEESGNFSICITLKPFVWCEETNETEIRLDFIDFGSVSFQDLSYKNFEFPINPSSGIDGSVYLENAHNPINILSISFGSRMNELCEHSREDSTDCIITTILYKFCWEGYKSELYPEIGRLDLILKNITRDYEAIANNKEARIQRRLTKSASTR